MAKPLHDQIVAGATKILANEPQGVRSTPLIRTHIRNSIPDLTLGDSAIHQVLLNYVRQPDAVIYQPGRGIFRHTRFRDTAEATPVVSLPLAVERIAEEMFYQPFAEWLVADLEECTKAKPVGGNKLKDKWGTPDVIGVRKPSVGDVIPAPIEIVSAEIKVPPMVSLLRSDRRAHTNCSATDRTSSCRRRLHPRTSVAWSRCVW
jgi:hypothetical protein